MARNQIANMLSGTEDAVRELTAEAAAGALRAGAAAARGKGPARGRMTLAQLSELCGQAADHLAHAHSVLFEEGDQTESALGHMNAALSCLRKVAAQSERRKKPRQTKAAKRARSA